MEHTVKQIEDIYKLSAEDLLQGNSKLQLFDYSQEEYDDFSKGFDVLHVREMLESVSVAMKIEQPDVDLVNYLVNYIRQLTKEDLERFEGLVEEFTDQNPNMLWNMISAEDRKLYGKPEKFYDWLSTLSEDDMEDCIYKAADGEKIHSADKYAPVVKIPPTKVEILDGYIAISSSNLQALDKFRDRMIRSNSCTYEHRVKTHEGVKIHSYIFNMDKTSE